MAGSGPDPIDLHVGRRLRARREEVGMSQSAIAKVIGGVSFQQIQKYEKGSNRISASRLYMASKALRVPVGYFFEGLT